MAARDNGEERVEQEANLATAPGPRRNYTDKIKVESKRQVTFSKRRNGLFKKLSELVTLTGAEAAGMVFSPGGRVFTFGHPSPDAIFRKFLDEELEPQTGFEMTERLVHEHRSARQGANNLYITHLDETINFELRNGEDISRERRETEGKGWWERVPKKELNFQQLELLFMKYKEFKHGVDAEVLQLHQERQEQEELNGGVRVGVAVPVPVPSTNVMGGGGTDGGLVIDPKGKGSAGELQSSLVSFDPMVGGSSSRPPLDPKMSGFHGGVPNAAPLLIGSSNPAPLDPMSTFGAGLSFNPGSGNQLPIDPMMPGSSFEAPNDPLPVGSVNQALNPIHGGSSVSFNPMSVGTSTQVPKDFRKLGFYGQPLYEPMASGSNASAAYNHMGIGSSNGSGMPFNLNPSSGGEPPYDPMASGSNVAAAFARMGMGSTDGSGMPFNLNPSHGSGPPNDPMASGSNATPPFDQMWMGSTNGSGMRFNLNPSGGSGPPYYPMASGSNGGAAIGQMQTGSTDGSEMPFNLNPSG